MLQDDLICAQMVLSKVSVGLVSDDLSELLWSVTQLARIRYYGEADLAVIGASILLERGESALRRVIPYLGRREENLRHLAVEACRIAGVGASPYIDNIMAFLEQYPEEVIEALLAVSQSPDSYLHLALASENQRVRFEAARVLDCVPRGTVLHLLTTIASLLSDPDPQIRIFALEGLEVLGPGDVPEELLKRIDDLCRDPDVEVCRSAGLLRTRLAPSTGSG